MIIQESEVLVKFSFECRVLQRLRIKGQMKNPELTDPPINRSPENSSSCLWFYGGKIFVCLELLEVIDLLLQHCYTCSFGIIASVQPCDYSFSSRWFHSSLEGFTVFLTSYRVNFFFGDG